MRQRKSRVSGEGLDSWPDPVEVTLYRPKEIYDILYLNNIKPNLLSRITESKNARFLAFGYIGMSIGFCLSTITVLFCNIIWYFK